MPPQLMESIMESSAALPSEGDLASLPAALRPGLFHDFQQASESGDVEHLSNTVADWLRTARLYEQQKTRTALETSPSFRALHERLVSLLQNEAGEEEAVPTGHAYSTALALLLDAHSLVEDFPRASITADETGGIRIQWLQPDRQVRLIIPAEKSGRQYLYFETDRSYDLEDDPSPTALAQRLRWFVGGSA